MSTTNARLQARREQGFITQLNAAGVPKTTVRAVFPRFQVQLDRRHRKEHGCAAAAMGYSA